MYRQGCSIHTRLFYGLTEEIVPQSWKKRGKEWKEKGVFSVMLAFLVEKPSGRFPTGLVG
jgi:branched-subunit amino acid ABC-type transport system permease component